MQFHLHRKLAYHPFQFCNPSLFLLQILRLLESGKFTQSELGKGLYKEKVQTTLFEAPSSKIEEQIRELDLEHMSPVEAFDLLRRLKDELS